jgi:hypothetical protein
MHQECNIVENIINMYFEVTGFSKDNINAKKDLAALCNCPSLEPKRNAKGKSKKTTSSILFEAGRKKRDT